MRSERRRVAILISGRGSNMARLVEDAAERDSPVEIVGILSDRADAAGLVYAVERGIPARSIARADFASKAEHEAALQAELEALGVELICLAGYMRIFSSAFVERWAGRMINIHPSLLPLFRGLDTHRRAIEAGVRIHGCTVHFVTPGMDEGPIIAQAAVPVLTEDDEAALSARVLKAEHQLYPASLRLVAEGKARMEDGRVVYAGLRETPRDGRGRLYSPTTHDGEIDLEALARITP